MKFSQTFYYTFTAILIIASEALYAQPEPRRLLGSFIYNNKTYNYEFSKEDENKFTFKTSTADATPSGDNPPTYRISTLAKEQFEAMFVQQMTVIHHVADDKQLHDKAVEIFFSIQARLGFMDDEPVTAYLILRRDSIYSFIKSNAGFYDGRLSNAIANHYINSVSVETEDGAIKNIKVRLVDPSVVKNFTETPRQFLEFKNQYPISLSGKFDPEKFADINLYCHNCAIPGLSRYIRLTDLLIFDIELENNKEDYSPSNRKVNLSPTNPIVELKKEKRSRILEVAAFTDFAGLDQEQPNGLIQVEAKRKININTKYHPFVGHRDNERLIAKYNFNFVEEQSPVVDYNKEHKVYNKFVVKYKGDDGRYRADTLRLQVNRFRSPYYNFFGSLEPRLLFSKLEENNRNIDSIKAVSKVLDPLLLYQYQLASFGVKVNLFKMNFPQLKFNWNILNVGAYWFRTRIALTGDPKSKESVPLNGLYYQFGTNAVFSPDSRWGVTIGFDYIVPKLWNADYSIRSNKGLMQPYFDAFIKTDEEAKLFFRFKWTYEKNNRNNNFTQIQLGYSMNIFAGSNTPKTKS